MRRPAVLRSRFVVVPVALAMLIGGWNVYVARHDHGRLTGRVVDTAGHPVAGATVVLFEQQFTNQVERARTETDGGGWFHFTGSKSHLIELQASGPGRQVSPRRIVRLWFRAQDRVLQQPLVVSGP
jgi:Carboxypeptidase regulatory-like domain